MCAGRRSPVHERKRIFSARSESGRSPSLSAAMPMEQKISSAVGTRDNYVTAIGFSQKGRTATLVILLRFKKLEQPEQLKSALKDAAIKKGKLGAIGSNFVRWEWNYAFAKPKAEEVAKLVEDLRTAIKPVTAPFHRRFQH